MAWWRFLFRIELFLSDLGVTRIWRIRANRIMTAIGRSFGVTQ